MNKRGKSIKNRKHKNAEQKGGGQNNKNKPGQNRAKKADKTNQNKQ